MKLYREFSASVLFISILSSSPSWALRWEEPPKETLGVRLGFVVPSLGMDIKPPKGSTLPNIQYSPHTPLKTAIGFSYGPFGVGASMSNPTKPEDDLERGTSQITDLQFRFYHRYGTYELFYQYYSGYFIENTTQIDSAQTESKIKRPDLRNIHYGFQYLHNFDEESFSMGASFDQGNRQVKSGGAWLGLAAYNSHEIKADFSLIPANVTAAFGEFSEFKGGRFASLRVGGGYGHSFVYDPYYLSFVFVASAGQQQQRYSLLTSEINRYAPNSGLNLRAGLGSNGKKYYGGIQLIGDITTIPISSVETTMSTAEASVFFGTRFFDAGIPFLDSFSEWLFGK